MEIQKTLSLRILRPLYSPEVESEIKAEKDRRRGEGKSEHLEPAFWKGLKARHPEIITNDEFFPLLSEIQRPITAQYNAAISKLYTRIVVNKEKVSVDKALSEGPYHDFKTIFNSYISLGLRQKIQSNFRLKELRSYKSALPTAKSDTFPIPIYKENFFKILEDENGDFIITLPLQQYTLQAREGKRPMLELTNPPEIKNVPVILSTLRRRRNSGQWFRDEGTNAEIRRVMAGEYKVSWAEIIRRTRFGRHDDGFVNLSIKYDKSEEGLNPNIIGGIDIGVSSPLVCAVNNALDRYSVRSHDIIAFSKRAMARRRTLLRQNRYKRAGHGSKNKLEPITILTEKNERFKKSIMQRWAKEVAEFFSRRQTAIVQMEKLSGIKESEDFFSKSLRMYWNYGQLQSIIENKLKDYGIVVKYISPKDTSKKCHSCGHINDYFTFEYREENKFPLFECKGCNVECNADYNAAKNIANTVS